jgi:hypothetical protein
MCPEADAQVLNYRQAVVDPLRPLGIGGFMYKRAHWYFLAALIVTFAGFFPTYFGRLGDAAVYHHIHAITATLWILLLICQGFLMSRGKVTWHRRLGKSSLLLFPVLVVTAVWILRNGVDGALDQDPVALGRLFLADWILLPFGVAMYLAALINRRDVQIHQRCMSLTLLPLFPPALGRMIFFYILYPLGYGFGDFWHPMMIVMVLVLAAAITHDKKAGQLHWPYVAGFVVTVIAYLAGTFAHPSEAVLGFLRWTAL